MSNGASMRRMTAGSTSRMILSRAMAAGGGPSMHERATVRTERAEISQSVMANNPPCRQQAVLAIGI